MLNKIWAGLILIGILFALAQDIYHEVYNTYENGARITCGITSDPKNPQQFILQINNQPVSAEKLSPDTLRLHLHPQSPQHLQLRALAQGIKPGINPSASYSLQARLLSLTHNQVELILPELYWPKLRAVTQAAFDMAEFAVKLALGLIGLMALWLGLMQIAQQSGLIMFLVRPLKPLLRWLFPNIPEEHAALGSISLNMAANILGLGNAATPMGIKAMQQLQQLNPSKQQASDEMCMFLALNTSSVQLLPPVTLIALMGTQISELLLPIILATSCSTVTAVLVARFYARRRSRSCNN